MFPFVSFLRTLPLHLLHLEPTNGRVNVWKLICISRELQRQCNLASQPNKTCCDEPSSYFPLTLSLSCSLSTLSLLLRLLLLKQTNRRISTDDVLLQAASFNGRRMAFARDPSLSTVHTSNHEIILVDMNAPTKNLQTQNIMTSSCCDASFLVDTASINCPVPISNQPNRWHPRARVQCKKIHSQTTRLSNLHAVLQCIGWRSGT